MTMQRWLYRGGRPNRLARILDALTAQIVARGRAPGSLATLEVEGRRSGEIARVPLVVISRDRERYLVSMLGDRSDWVRNVQASGGRAVLCRGTREQVILADVPVADRAPILKEYVEIAQNGRAHIPVPRGAPVSDFARIADAFPVFRVVPLAT